MVYKKDKPLPSDMVDKTTLKALNKFVQKANYALWENCYLRGRIGFVNFVWNKVAVNNETKNT